MSIANNPIDINEVMKDSKLLQIVNSILKQNDQTNNLIRFLKLESIWILINISYGQEEEVNKILDVSNGISAGLMNILKGNDFQLIDEIFFFFSNIMYNGVGQVKQIMDQFQIIDNVIILYQNNNQKVPDFLNESVFQMVLPMSKKVNMSNSFISKIYSLICMAVFLNCKMPPNYKVEGPNPQIKDSIILKQSASQGLIMNIMRIMNSLSKEKTKQITFLVEQYHLDMIVNLVLGLLDSSHHFYGNQSQIDTICVDLLENVLEFVGNISSSDKQTKLMFTMLENGLQDKLSQLLNSQNTQVSKYCCWIFSNIVAEDGAENIENFLDYGPVLEISKMAAKNQSEINIYVKKEAIWVLSNLCECSKTDQLSILFHKTSIKDDSFDSSPGITGFTNMTMKAFINGLKDVQEQNQILCILEAISKLLSTQKNIIVSSDETTVLDQFLKLEGEEALNNCIQKYCGEDLLSKDDGSEGIQIFNLVNHIIQTAQNLSKEDYLESTNDNKPNDGNLLFQI